jgi:hypothetical protein
MTRRAGHRWAWRLTLGAGAVAVSAACTSSTTPRQLSSCPTYKGGHASDTTLAGNYTLASFCQDTLPAAGPAQGVTGTLTLTAPPNDSFKVAITRPMQLPVNLAGPYKPSHDTITVTLALGQFVATYAFAANTLYVSGSLPAGGMLQPIALVFAHQ